MKTAYMIVKRALKFKIVNSCRSPIVALYTLYFLDHNTSF